MKDAMFLISVIIKDRAIKAQMDGLIDKWIDGLMYSVYLL